MLFSSAILLSSVKSDGLPNKLTVNIAAGLCSTMAFLTSFISKFSVCKSTSQKINLSPYCCSG